MCNTFLGCLCRSSSVLHVVFIVVACAGGEGGLSSFLTAYQHLLGYLVPSHGMVDLHKGGYNQGYLATIKMNALGGMLAHNSDLVTTSVVCHYYRARQEAMAIFQGFLVFAVRQGFEISPTQKLQPDRRLCR